jgi:hypothetical protein
LDAASERADIELDRLITKRHDPHDGDALLEPSYADSVRRYNAQRDEENRSLWREHHQEQAARLRAALEDLIARHEAAAASLRETAGGEGRR